MSGSQPPTAGKRLLEDYDDLLKSGLFSDVTVRCGDREWKLHRSVICVKSAYFEKALCGNFKEAETRVVNLDEQDPDVLDCLIKAMYESVDNIECEGFFEDSSRQGQHFLNASNNRFVALMQLHEAAEYFLVGPAGRETIRQLENDIKSICFDIRQNYCRRNRPGADPVSSPARRLYALLPDIKGPLILQAIDYAFTGKSKNEYIQSILVNLGVFTNFWILHDKAFKEKLSQVPALSVGILDGMLNSNLGKYFHIVPEECTSCQRDHESASMVKVILVVNEDSEKPVVKGQCW